YFKLGTKYIAEINKQKLPPVDDIYSPQCLTPEQQEKGDLLLLLDRDQQEIIYCHYCRILHHYAKTLSGRWGFPRRRLVCTSIEFVERSWTGRSHHCHHFHDNFYFSKVQFIMKLYRRFGLGCFSQLEELSKTCIYRDIWSPYSNTLEFKGSKFAHYLRTWAQIASGNLIIKSDHWLLVPSAAMLLTPGFPEYGMLRICPHLDASENYDSGGSLLRDLICRHILVDGEVSTDIYQCTECPTDFQIHHEILEDGFALIVSVWQNFGDGVSPLAPEWQSHTRKMDLPSPPPKFPCGSIKEQFERVYFRTALDTYLNIGQKPRISSHHCTPYVTRCS
ncbi:hypothetical protein F5884DRAFT_178589, partial [Xylogone sp. PMI_703]